MTSRPSRSRLRSERCLYVTRIHDDQAATRLTSCEVVGRRVRAVFGCDIRDSALRSDTWTSIIATSLEPLLVRQYLFAHMFPGTVDGQPDRAVVEALLPKIGAALDVVETALGSGVVGTDPFGRVDAYLVPILFYVRNMPEGGPMIAARPHLSAYLDRSLARPSVQTTMPPPLPGRR